eukprot:6766915-Heterocapsa_arctica.AAC.2
MTSTPLRVHRAASGLAASTWNAASMVSTRTGLSAAGYLRRYTSDNAPVGVTMRTCSWFCMATCMRRLATIDLPEPAGPTKARA